MKSNVLSLWEPWATAMALGLKSVETRSWATPYRGPIYLHAAAKKTKACEQYWQHRVVDFPHIHELFRSIGYPAYHTLPFGCIVARAELVDCRPTTVIDRGNQGWCHNPPDRFTWTFKAIQRLDHPIAAKGARGLWQWNKTY